MQAQISKEGLTVDQMNYRNVNPEMRRCNKSTIVKLISEALITVLEVVIEL